MHPLVLKLKRWQYVVIVACIVTLGVVLFFSWPKVANPPVTPTAFKDATQAMRDGEYQTAIDLFTAIVTRDPTNDAAYLNRAACYAAIGEELYMVGDAEEALTINSKSVAALKLLAAYWLDSIGCIQ